jgi:hypothetical protein
MMQKGLLLCLALLALNLPATGHAHRLQSILSTVSYNERTRMLEVVHETHAHDVEFALVNLSEYPNGLENIRAQALAGLELVKDFHLWDSTGNAIELQLVGAELEADIFYVYQEASMAGLPNALQVEQNMLMTHWPDMQNTVNVDYANGVKSLFFEPGDGSKSVSE